MRLHSLAPLVLIGAFLPGLPVGAHDTHANLSFGATSIEGARASDYDDVLQEYAEANSKFQDDLLNAKSLDERAKLLKKSPVHKFWRKFDRAAKSDVRALVWMLHHAAEKESDPKKMQKLVDGLARRVLKSDVTTPDFGDVLSVIKDIETLAEDDLLALYDQVLETSSHHDVKAQAQYRKAWLFHRSQHAERKDQFDAQIELCAKTYGGTRYGTLALASTVQPSDLEEGKPAPNFYAETLEGHGFKLSDYKGKIVLIDFYGFW